MGNLSRSQYLGKDAFTTVIDLAQKKDTIDYHKLWMKWDKDKHQYNVEKSVYMGAMSNESPEELKEEKIDMPFPFKITSQIIRDACQNIDLQVDDSETIDEILPIYADQFCKKIPFPDQGKEFKFKFYDHTFKCI